MEWYQWMVIGWFSFTFMIPFIAWNVLLIWFLEEESPGYAFISTAVFIGLIQVCSNFSIPGWVTENPGSFIKWGLAYIGIGVIYSILKYILYLIESRRNWDRKFGEFKEKRKLDNKISIDTIPEDQKRSCFEHMRYNEIPTVKNSTRHIVFWMGYWPWSAVWTLINNPLKWVYEELKLMLGGLWRKLHTMVLGSRINAMESWKDLDRDGNVVDDELKKQTWEYNKK